MKNIICSAIVLMGLSANAQWSKPKTTETTIISYYVEKNDTIARKWTDLYTGEKYVTATDNDNYISVWKVDKDNYISLFVEKLLPWVEEKKHYDVVILMSDNTRLQKRCYSARHDDDNEKELVITLSPEEVKILKAKDIKGVMVENYVIDSKTNGLNLEFLKKCINIVWPTQKAKKKQIS